MGLKNALFAGIFAVTSTVALAASADDAQPAPAATPLQMLHDKASKPLALAPNSGTTGTPLGYKLVAGSVVVVAGGLWLRKKQKNAKDKAAKKKSEIDVLGRASIGVRNELLVVEVEGTRLLVGMTPGSMQTLAVLQTPENVVGEESPILAGEMKYAFENPVSAGPVAAAPVSQPRTKTLREQMDEDEDSASAEAAELSDRVRSLLNARQKTQQMAIPAPVQAEPAPAPTPIRRPQIVAQTAAAANGVGPKARVPGQAKGLLLSMSEGMDQ